MGNGHGERTLVARVTCYTRFYQPARALNSIDSQAPAINNEAATGVQQSLRFKLASDRRDKAGRLSPTASFRRFSARSPSIIITSIPLYDSAAALPVVSNFNSRPVHPIPCMDYVKIDHQTIIPMYQSVYSLITNSRKHCCLQVGICLSSESPSDTNSSCRCNSTTSP